MSEIADLVVVGAGIAGSSVARAARAAGLSVQVIASHEHPCASLVAVGLVRESWAGDANARRMVRYSLRQHAALEALVPACALVYPRQGEPKPDPAYQVVLPYRVLLPPDVVGSVVRVEERAVLLADDTRIAARLGVVVCAGAQTPALGGRPFTQLLWGATAIALRVPRPVSDYRVAVHQIRPYHVLAHVLTPMEERWGSTSGKTALAAETRLVSELHQHLGYQVIPGVVQTGLRAYTGTSGAALPAPFWRGSTCYLAGFAKSGYAYAPALAAIVVGTYQKGR